MSEPLELRLDLVLYNLRFCKTRALAQILIERNRVRVNGNKVAKASRKIRIGDVLVFPAHGDIQSIEIIGLPTKRLGAQLARENYQPIPALNQHAQIPEEPLH